MPVTISNQATLSFNYGTNSGTVSSNIAQTVLREPVSVDVTSLDTTFAASEELTYIITITNSGSSALTNVVAVDDLGTYEVPVGTTGTVTVTPLTHLDPALVYINGEFAATISGNVNPGGGVVFNVGTIPASSSATVIYKVRVNEYANPFVSETITNTVTVTATGLPAPISDTYTVTAEELADISIIKTMTPNPVVDGNEITYTFTIYNYGNTEATGVELTDVFSPIPDIISVEIDGVTVSTSDYSYSQTSGELTLPTGSQLTITVPEATFTRDSAGVITVSPGIVTITVTGTL